jgi:hypothetical protein
MNELKTNLQIIAIAILMFLAGCAILNIFGMLVMGR